MIKEKNIYLNYGVICNSNDKYYLIYLDISNNTFITKEIRYIKGKKYCEHSIMNLTNIVTICGNNYELYTNRILYSSENDFDKLKKISHKIISNASQYFYQRSYL